jgi:hypothetical protein
VNHFTTRFATLSLLRVLAAAAQAARAACPKTFKIGPMSSKTFPRMAAVLAGVLAGSASAAPVYHIIDLGSKFLVTAMNKNGVVVGWKQVAGVGDQPSIYRNGHWNPIEKGVDAQPAAVDVSGDVVGYESGLGSVLWPRGGGAPVSVGPTHFRTNDTFVSGVNDDQVVVGSAISKRDRQWHCFRWENGVGKDLNAPRDCIAGSINRQGWIIGYGTSELGAPHTGFIWAGSHFHWFDDQPTAIPASINDEGHLAGTYEPPGQFDHAFLYDGTQFIDIGLLPGMDQSFGQHINDHDEVLGTMNSFRHGTANFLYSGGQLYDLDALVDNLGKWHLNVPVGIDNDGNVVGYGNLAGHARSWMAVRISQ